MNIYRIEHRDTHDGMWYNFDGTYNGFIFNLTEGKSKNMPMDYNAKYSKDGLTWVSGVVDRDQLLQWFSPLDIRELFHNGYSLFHFVADQYVIEDGCQVLFTREGIKSRVEVEDFLLL